MLIILKNLKEFTVLHDAEVYRIEVGVLLFHLFVECGTAHGDIGRSGRRDKTYSIDKPAIHYKLMDFRSFF